MDIYLIPSKGERLHIPVNPQKITVGGSIMIDTLNLMGRGEVDIPIGDERTTIEFESFFPLHYDTYCQYTELKRPEEYMAMLVGMRLDKKPVRLLITGTYVNVMVLIKETPRDYVGGEPGDIYYRVSMRQWVDTNGESKDEAAPKVQGENTPRPRADTKPVPKIYTVKSGDSLWTIAKIQLGSGSKAASIYNLNKKVIGPDMNLIKPGQKLVMPV